MRYSLRLLQCRAFHQQSRAPTRTQHTAPSHLELVAPPTGCVATHGPPLVALHAPAGSPTRLEQQLATGSTTGPIAAVAAWAWRLRRWGGSGTASCPASHGLARALVDAAALGSVAPAVGITAAAQCACHCMPTQRPAATAAASRERPFELATEPAAARAAGPRLHWPNSSCQRARDCGNCRSCGGPALACTAKCACAHGVRRGGGWQCTLDKQSLQGVMLLEPIHG